MYNIDEYETYSYKEGNCVTVLIIIHVTITIHVKPH